MADETETERCRRIQREIHAMHPDNVAALHAMIDADWEAEIYLIGEAKMETEFEQRSEALDRLIEEH